MLTLIPSYGRDYQSAKLVKADWDANKDFTIANLFHPDDGRVMNKEQAKPGEKFLIRYKRQASIVIVKG